MIDVDLASLLPHREPFLWVDRVVEIEPGVRCVALKDISADAFFFEGHFPEDPVVPGVFLIEAAAQTGGIMLAAGATSPGATKRLAAVNHFKFLEAVAPGATIAVETERLIEHDGMAVVGAVVRISDRVVAKGELVLVSR